MSSIQPPSPSVKVWLEKLYDELGQREVEIDRLKKTVDEQVEEIDRLTRLIRNIDEIYIHGLDKPGPLSWSERTRKRVELSDDINQLMTELGKEQDQ